jgi:hypothetical protein
MALSDLAVRQADLDGVSLPVSSHAWPAGALQASPPRFCVTDAWSARAIRPPSVPARPYWPASQSKSSRSRRRAWSSPIAALCRRYSRSFR